MQHIPQTIPTSALSPAVVVKVVICDGRGTPKKHLTLKLLDLLKKI